MLHFILKICTFSLLLLLFVACGLMNNSKEDSSSNDTMAVPSNTSLMPENDSLEIFTQVLPQTENNKAFIDELGYFNHPQTPNYRILNSNNAFQTFISDINTSAQALNEVDKKVIYSWISNIKRVFEDSNQSNLLFLPILNNNSCPLSRSIEIIENQAIISIQKENRPCDIQPLYYALFYNIERSIEEIKIIFLGEVSILMNDEH